MKSRFLKTLASIRNCTSGNATVLLALGTPLLVGGAGLGVDLAQWYSWKRELQFAVDQGAIAGAWARASDSSGDYYKTRASQEYDANLHMVADFDSGATVTLEDYDGGTDNSVLVEASATSKLPFSAFLTGSATTVSVSAQAIYEPAGVYNPCIVALDKSSASALKFNGSPALDADCGVGALSPAKPAGRSDGAGPIDIPYVITAGTFKDANDSFLGQVIENARDLSDPFDGLTPPDNPTPRSLSCPGATNYTATENITVVTSYAYYTGASISSLVEYANYPTPQTGSTTTTSTTGVGMATIPTPNPATTTEVSYLEIEGKGNNKVWEVRTTKTTKLYNSIVTNTTSSATMLPGTYSSFDPRCDLTLATGVYVIDGTTLKINAQYKIAGNGVMFVLKNGAGLQINGGAKIDLTAMNVTQLMAAGVSADDAVKMENMLIFEDPNSPGSNRDNTLNGNALTTLNGYIYTPNSGISITGSSKATSSCLMIASKTVDIGGSADLSSSCDPDLQEDKTAISTSRTLVRLVG